MRGKKDRTRQFYEVGSLLIIFTIIIQLFFLTGLEVMAKDSSINDSSSVAMLQSETSSSKPIEKEATNNSAGKKATNSSLHEKDTNKPKETQKFMEEDLPLEGAATLNYPQFSTRAEPTKEGELTILGALYHCMSDGTSRLVNGNGIENKVFTVPANTNRVVNGSIKYYKLTRINKEAFQNNSKITGLKFNENSNLEIIESNAFFSCPNLAGTLSFANCPKLKTIEERAFASCRNVTGIDFGSNSVIETVGEQAFRNCTGVGGKTVVIPNSVRNMGSYAFINDDNNYKELLHKKIAKVTGALPSLEVAAVSLPEEAKEYESKVDSSENKTLLHKGAKWTSDDRTTAEIRLDYGYNYDRLANVDIVFVVDNSGSMTSPTPVRDANRVLHNFPRAFLAEDILGDAAKMLLETDKAGYNNRMSLVAFGGGNTPIYKTGFMTTSAEVKNQLRSHPVTKHELTNYNAGLQGAIDVLTAAKDPNRSQAVIFLSDGAPSDGNIGINQADKLRDLGIHVYPIAMYFETEAAPQALINISYDKKTTYIANDTESFEKIMTEVIEDVVNQAEPLEVKIEDVLSKEFELQTGKQADFELSPEGGNVTIDGQKLTWDLDGCAQGVAHTLKIKVKVKAGTELTATGVLPTNESMRATDNSITSNEQPKLERYLAHHRFEHAADSTTELPEKVMALLPRTKGGYGDGTKVDVSPIDRQEEKTEDGRTWKFIGWDQDSKTIKAADVTFIGKWKFSGYDFSFIKLDNDSNGLAGAEFSLYVWTGSGEPQNSDLVNDESIAAGKWRLLDAKTSQANGRIDFYVPAEEGSYFQLAETKVPDSYAKPQGQWRFTFDVNGYIENNRLVGIAGQNNTLPPPFEVIEEGEFQGFLGVKNEPARAQLPATGGFGRTGFTRKAAAFCSIGLLLSSLYVSINRRKKDTLEGKSLD